ncbi:hypothetical protein GKD00_08680 [Lactobacillus ruminis]|uniref:hypothetical protein n=1 Tax=Ligilactobacillus ruminis TaxID=1623 RepID=UPI0010E1D246|nr:hypothetical protein [Ligilactobacillus ruminis]MSB44581.1 hypothetical protein [Ligilactobacillus ruminis]MSB82020.1 hypothetical protein [Ligilactobacillus ruminis]MSB91622.1 hypothetical protein [Ligilactobacillus ruminis]RYS79463.1 hypothetical protein EAI77_06220 [Ligilactobacillus ruminis]
MNTKNGVEKSSSTPFSIDPWKLGQLQKQSQWHPNQTKNLKKYFTAAPIQKQNKITSSLKFVIMEERKLRRFSP